MRRSFSLYLFARGIGSAASLVFTPILFRAAGAAGFAFVSAFATLQSIISIADIGVSSGVVRAVARARALGQDPTRLVAAVERVAARTMAGLVLLIVVLPGTPLSRVMGFPSDSEVSLRICAAGASARLGVLVYGAALQGLERPGYVLLVALVTAVTKLMGALALTLTDRPAPRFIAVLLAAASAVELLAAGLFVRSVRPADTNGDLPESGAGEELRNILGFAGPVGFVTALGVGFSTLPSVILPRLSGLATLGAVSAAQSMCSAFYVVAYPLATALYPRIVRENESARGGGAELAATCVALLGSTLLVPVVVILRNPGDVSRLAGGAQHGAEIAHVIAPVAVYVFADALMAVPHITLLALGRTKTLISIGAARFTAAGAVALFALSTGRSWQFLWGYAIVASVALVLTCLVVSVGVLTEIGRLVSVASVGYGVAAAANLVLRSLAIADRSAMLVVEVVAAGVASLLASPHLRNLLKDVLVQKVES